LADNISYNESKIDDDTVLVTSAANKQDIESRYDSILSSALDNYNTKKPEMYSVYPADETSSTSITIDYIDQLAVGLNSTISNLRTANSLILRNVVSDSLLGRAYESIVANINTKYRLNYPETYKDKTTDEQWDDVKYLINSFNLDINIESLIRDSISIAYLEGNYPMYLRIKDNGAVIDHYPLAICYPSDYRINGENALEFNIDNLKSKLRKTYTKNRKNKAVYFENIQKEIKANYPSEVVKAYNDGEKLTRLDTKYSGCLKVNAMGRKFGVSPFFRCLKPLIVLSNIETADVAASKSRSKKIIFQKLRKELMGEHYDKKGLAEQALAHESAAQAIKTNFCLYTAPAFVESLEYVTDEANDQESSALLKVYTSKLMTALGIGFVDSEISTVTVANISINQMLRTINSISKQLERVLHKFYQDVLEANGFDPQLAPYIDIADSEEMEASLKKDIASFVYTTLNGSLETAYEYMGLDFNEEKRRRQSENDDGLTEVFYPRATSNTTAGNNIGDTSKSAGRPADSEDTEKQANDKARNDAK